MLPQAQSANSVSPISMSVTLMARKFYRLGIHQARSNGVL
jgi:hypothetical protein